MTSKRVLKLRKIIEDISTYRGGVYWNKIVKNRLPDGYKKLSEKEKQAVKSLFGKYGKVNENYHEFYKNATGKFYENYIPDDLYYCKIDPYFNNWALAEYLDNKCYYKTIFPDVKQPETIACRMNRIWYIDNMPTTFEKVLAVLKGNESFVKMATDSEGGAGVFYLPSDVDVKKVVAVIDSIDTDIVIQQAIKQSKTMSELNKSSVNTIRLLSFLDQNGNVKIYSSVVRMGIDNSKVDNASSGGITCGIEKDGRLKPIAYSAKGQRFENHPNTHLQFDTVTIPKYRELEELVKKLHIRLPHFRLLSWDFALGVDDEPILIEVNLRYGELDFHQLNNGPVFGNDTKKILEEVFRSDI